MAILKRKCPGCGRKVDVPDAGADPFEMPAHENYRKTAPCPESGGRFLVPAGAGEYFERYVPPREAAASAPGYPLGPELALAMLAGAWGPPRRRQYPRVGGLDWRVGRRR